MLALRKEGDEVWSTDVAVPLSRLPDIIGMSLSISGSFGIDFALRNLEEGNG